MDSVSEAQFELDQLRLVAKRQLFATVMLGVMAGFLAFVGQSALSQARPLLEPSFGTWQSLYSLVLWALAIAWLVALGQQAFHYQTINERFESQRRLDTVYAERAAKAQAAEDERQRQRAETEARQIAERNRRANKNARSTKFDY
jgi:biopolymer transport protein ExbB/TolQ